jgi:hypothetical protein
MTPGEGKRALAAGLAVLLAQGCATVHHEVGGGLALTSGASYPGEVSPFSAPRSAAPTAAEWRAEAEARRAEVEWALSRMWAVASGEDEVGAALGFTFWCERGALTLLSHRRAGGTGKAGQPADAESFARGLRGLLTTLAETRTGGLTFTLHREGNRWRVDYETALLEEPAEARRRPARRTGPPDKTLAAVRAMASKVVRLLQVPEGATARMQLELKLEDDRLTGWEPGPYQATPGGKARPAHAWTAEALTGVLLPFTRAPGPRTVRLALSGAHEGASATSRWRVERAETVRPAPVDEALEDVLREYRRMQADIFHRYREEMVDTVELAGAFTLEQVALYVMGGMVSRGLHRTFEVVAPTVTRLFARGGAEGMRWFRTQLVRAGRQEQELLRRLWMKVETRGLDSLSAAERGELTRLMRSMEQALTVKLDTRAKDALRAKAHEDFYDTFHPELAGLLRNAKGMRYDAHHHIPLEHAHLFPALDINAAANLSALSKPVHKCINKAWNLFRNEVGDTASPEQVRRMKAIIDRHFSRWYNAAYDPRQPSELLEKALEAALDDVRALVAR